MREKIEKPDSGKVFLAGTLMVLAAYGLLWLVQFCCAHRTGDIMFGEPRESWVPKFTVPFPCYSSPFSFGWCFIMEWSVPLFLCLAYVAVAAGQKRIHILITGIMAAGIGKVYVSRQLTSDMWYWKAADRHIGKLLPPYFMIWLLAALLLMIFAPKCLKRFGRSLRAKTICLFLVFLFSLSEGILFNVVYFGQYTLFYAVRSLLILLLVLLSVWHLSRSEAVQADVEQGEGEQPPKEVAMPVKIFGIGMSVCFLAYFLVVSVAILCRIHRLDAWSFPYPLIENYLHRHFAVLLVVAVSVYSVKAKKGYVSAGVLAVLCGIAFWVQGFFLNREPVSVWGTTTSLTVWVTILFLLFTWLWKESKWSKIIFHVLLYLIVIGSKCIELLVVERESASYFAKFNILYMILCVMMFGVTLYALVEAKMTETKAVQGKKGIYIWLLLFSYALFAFFDVEILWANGRISVLGILTQHMGVSGTNVMYVFAFLILVSFLAHAMKKKEMQLFCSLAAITAVHYIESRGGCMWSRCIEFPVSILFMVMLLFCFPFLTKLFPKKENILGGMFLLITYVVLFCDYVLPLTSWDLSRYRWGWYVAAQVILLGITVLTFVLYGQEKQAMRKCCEKEIELQTEEQI